MNRKLINYLPEVLRNFREFREVFETEETELLKVQEEFLKVLNDLFVEDATERGVKRWEKILKITPKATEGLKDRKFRIISYITRKLPFTLRTLEQMLETLCGKNNYEIELHHNDYEIEVRINLADNNNIMDVLSLLEIVVPANLIQILKSYLTMRSEVPKYAIGGMSGEEITVYPWTVSELTSRGKVFIAAGYNTGVDNMTVYPKGWNIETIGKQYFGLGYQSAETIIIYPLQN